MFHLFSVGAAVIVFVALFVLVFRSPGQLTRPSVLFLTFWALQIQLSAAINASAYVGSLGSPWIFFAIVHGFPLSCLAIVLFTKRQHAEDVFIRIGVIVPKLPVQKIVLLLAFLLAIEYSIFFVYLYHVPFEKTGLYAALRAPEMLDSYRELSMKLLDNNFVRYLFSFLEKVIAPIAGVVLALLIGRLWFSGYRYYAVASALCIVVIIFPTLIYGARGPGAMVILALMFGFFLAFHRRLSVGFFAVSLALVLAVPTVLMVSKTQTFSAHIFTFQLINALDRAVGRGYLDNVWHIRNVEERGFYGVAGIEKLAPLFKEDPVDIFNEVAVKNKNNGTSLGLRFLEIDSPVVKKADAGDGLRSISSNPQCDNRVVLDCIDVSKSASSGASFVVMNYAMFGWYGMVFSLLFVYAMDFLLFVYKRMDELVLVPAVAAFLVPVLGLSFSMLTTSLVSKGLLLVPLTCLFLGYVLKNFFSKSTL